MIPNITQEGPKIVEQYWCGNCGAGLPPPYQLRDGEHKPTWKFCPICGEAIEYERAKPVQWAELNCERCGVNLIMEIQGEPKPRYIASRDYIGGSICRCCMEEHCAQTNCLQCEVGKHPDCLYTRIKKKALYLSVNMK